MTEIASLLEKLTDFMLTSGVYGDYRVAEVIPNPGSLTYYVIITTKWLRYIGTIQITKDIECELHIKWVGAVHGKES